MDFSSILTPEVYDQAAFLAREIAAGMLERLQWMTLQPTQVLDVGCGTGMDMQRLAERYPQAQIWGMDLAQSFVNYGKKQRTGRLAWAVADGPSLPLRSHSVDLIFANLLLPYVEQPAVLLREWRRVLRPNGLLLFSCLGPDTCKEWQGVEKNCLIPYLADLHNIGDALVEQGFADPVLEVENLQLVYRGTALGCEELVKNGIRTPDAPVMEWTPHEGAYPLTFEVVYAHAFCPATKGFKPDAQGVVKIPISQLKK